MSQTQSTIINVEPPIKINRTLYGVLLATLASIFWGSMGVCVQYIFENTNTQPQALSSLRLLLSGTVLVILNLFLSRRPLLAVFSSLKGSAGIALSGLELLGAHLTFFIAIYFSNAGTAAIFLATTPLLAGIYLFLRGKKRFTAKEGLCCALAFFGVLLIVSKGDFSTFQFNWLAVFWGMISAVFASIYSIQPKPLIDRWGVVPVASWGMMAARYRRSFSCQSFCDRGWIRCKGLAGAELYRTSRYGSGLLAIPGLFEIHFSGYRRACGLP